MLTTRAALFTVLTGIASSVLAQHPGEKVDIGIKTILHSDILKENRNVHIFLPDGYSSSDEKYPVLYTLYSMAPDYHYTTGIVAGLSRMRSTPKMIVVSVDLGDGKRDLTPTKSQDYGPTSGGARNFLKFLKTELVHYIDNNYRTGSQRIFWSHSIGGLFGLYALLVEPDLFSSILVSSPFFVYDRGEKYIINNTESFLGNRKGQENFLYICVGDEPQLITEIEEFLKILEESKPAGLTWKYVNMPEENHMSMLARSLTEGLRAFSLMND